MYRKLFMVSVFVFTVGIIVFATISTVAARDLEASTALADTDVVISEVYYLGASGADWFELKNTGSDTIDISNWYIEAEAVQRALSELTILSGDDLLLTPGEVIQFQSVNLDSGSNLGVYRTNSFTDPSAIVDFVQWGTNTVAGDAASTAFDAGLWTKTNVMFNQFDFVATASAGESVSFDGENGGGSALETLSSDFVNGTPSPGLDNRLNLTKVVDGSIVETGDQIQYTLIVTGSYVFLNHNVVLSDTMPTSTTLASASDSIVPTNGVLVWNLGTIMTDNVMITKTFVVTVDATTGSTVTNELYEVKSDEASADGAAVNVRVLSFTYLPQIVKQG